ncbi:hypothetical protein ACFLZV_05090 [Candidatus Margulisiibacteriota bacterium]
MKKYLSYFTDEKVKDENIIEDPELLQKLNKVKEYHPVNDYDALLELNKFLVIIFDKFKIQTRRMYIKVLMNKNAVDVVVHLIKIINENEKDQHYYPEATFSGEIKKLLTKLQKILDSPCDLIEESHKTKDNHTSKSQEIVNYVAENALSALYNMHKDYKAHSDIKPCNIFYRQRSTHPVRKTKART